MDKYTHSLGTMDDLRKSGGTPAISFADLPADERASMIGIILDHFGYVNLSREDKGIVRVFLQRSTGYSRAQVARYITAHLHSVPFHKPHAVSTSQHTWNRSRIFPALTFSLLLLLSSAIDQQSTGDLLNVLNAERTTGSGNVIANDRTLVVRTGSTELLAVHEQQGETLVASSLSALRQRVEARRIARLRLNPTNGKLATRPDISIEKEIFPAYDSSKTIHAAANDPWDIPATGVEGQILMIQNGKPVWRDFPYLEQIRNEAPHGNESTRRAGGNRSGGSENTVENNSSTTTIIQQVGGGAAPSGWTDANPFIYLTDDTASVGIGTATPRTKLEVIGTISGAALYIGGSISGASLHIDGTIEGSSLSVAGSITGSSLYIGATIDGAGLTSCNSINSKLVWNAATKQFECAIDQTVGTGLSQATGDERYVQKQGGTMTGALTIRITGGSSNTVGLNVINAISGAVIHAQNSLSTSGTLVFEGAASGSSLYIASSLQGVGLTDCDAATSQLKWDSTSGRFSCGTTFAEVGTLSFSGAVVRLGNTQWVKKSGDTMTGALAINVTGGSQNTLGLRVINALSGAVIHAEKSLTTSGTLVFEGAASGSSLYIASSLQGVGLTDCDAASQTLAWDASTGRFSCGTDADTTYTAAQGLTLNGTAFSLNSTITGALVRFNTVSGSTIYAKNILASSGTLLVEGTGSIAGRLTVGGEGNYSDLISGLAVLRVRSNAGHVLTFSDVNGLSAQNGGVTLRFFPDHGNGKGSIGTYESVPLAFITGNTERMRINAAGNVGVGTVSPKAKFEVSGGLSGATLYISSSMSGAGLSDCDLSTQKLIWDATTGRFGCSTDGGTSYYAGQGISMSAGNAFSLNTTITGSLVRFTTISGSIITAKTSLASSGSLTWEGAGSGSSLYIASSLQGVGLTDCDAASQVLKWDATSGRFSCGTATNNTFGSGNVIAIGDSKYVNVGGDTMTGTLVINPASGVALNARGTLSGSSLFTLSNYRGCTLKTSATGAVICGTDNGTSYYAGQGLSLSSNVFTLSSTITGSLVRFTTISGSTLYAKNLLASSGTLVTESGAYFDGTTLVVAAGPNRVGIGTATPKTALEVQGTISGALLYQGGGGVKNYLQGSLGIGADAGVYMLNLYNPTSTSFMNIETGNGASNGSIRVANPDRAWVLGVRGDISDSFGIADSTAGLVRMVVDTDGNVGIGVTNPDAKLEVQGTISGTLISLNAGSASLPALSFHGDMHTGIYWGGNDQLRFATAGTNRMAISGASVGIGTITPGSRLSVSGSAIIGNNVDGLSAKAQLDVKGSISGSTLTISGLNNCNTIDTDAQGNLICGSDATGGSGAPEVGTASFTGAVIRLGNTQYVKKSGDTMTGTLVIGNSKSLQVAGTISGTTLKILGTGSGNIFHAEKSLSTSGSLTWEGAASGSSLYIASSLQGVGLTDCDAASQTLAWDASTGRFSCGTDADTTYQAGQGLTLNGTFFSLNASLTGSSLKFQTISGSVIRTNSLNSSGSLTWEGAASGATLWVSSFDGAGLTDCDLSTSKVIWDATTKRFSCSTDQNTTAWSNTGSLQLRFDSRYLRTAGGTLTGSLVLRSTLSGASLLTLSNYHGCTLKTTSTGAVICSTDIDTNTTYQAGQGLTLNGTFFSLNASLTGSSLKFQTISGAIIRTNSLNSSGSLTWEGAASGATLMASVIRSGTSLNSSGSLTWEGAASGATLWVSKLDGAGLTNCDPTTGKLTWNSTTKQFACGTDQNTTAWSNTGSLQLRFDSRYLRTSGGTVTGALVLRSTLSGASLLTLSNYHGCTLKTTSTGAVICSTDIDTNTTYQAGQGLTLNGTFFSLNASLTGSSLKFQTISGAIIRTNSLNSSGSLTWEGAASGATLWTSTIRAGSSLNSSGSLTWEGAASGASLYIASSLQGVGLSDCDATTSQLKWDATTGRFSCGTTFAEVGTSSFSGAVVRLGNTQWVKKSGDTMTGTLVIGNSKSLQVAGTISGTTLKILGTGSGNIFHAEKSLSTSGTLVWEGAGSGASLWSSVIRAGTSLASSGTLSVRGTTSLAGAVTIGTTGSTPTSLIMNGDGTNQSYIQLRGVESSLGSYGLDYNGALDATRLYTYTGRKLSLGSFTFNRGAYTSRMLMDDATGNFGFGTTTPGSRLTVSGAMIIGINGNLGSSSAGSGLALEVIGTASGRVLFAQNTLASSGTLVWEGAGSGARLWTSLLQVGSNLNASGSILANGNIRSRGTLSGSLLVISNLHSCSLSVSATGAVICGAGGSSTPEVGTLSFSGAVVRLGNTQWVKKSGDTMTGALVINVTGGSQNTLGLRVINTASGAVFHAEKTLSSSGTLVWEGAGSGARLWVSLLQVGSNINASGSILANGNITTRGTISGALVTQNGRGLNYMRGNFTIGSASLTKGAFTVIGSGSFTGTLSGSALNIQGGTSYILGNLGIGTTSPKAKLDVVGTASGTKIFASKELSASGILVIRSLSVTGSGAATIVPTEFQTGAYISGSGAAALALDTYTNTGSRTPHILFGYRGTFDAGLYRVGRPGSGALALRVTNTQSTNTASAFEIYSNTTHTNNKVFRVAVNGATFSDGAYASTGADYAEWFMTKDTLLPGEVVCIDITKKNSVKRCTTDADGNVMGIVSTNPSFVGNQIGGAEGLMPPGYALVGLIGQVPAKVMVENGEAIRPGDSLTAASVAGYARKARAGESTVGVALEGLTFGQGVVNVLISRRNQSLTVEAVEDKVLKTIADMQIEDEVQLMVSSALGDLNVDEQISDEVTRQVDALAVQKAEIDTIKADIEQLKTQVAADTSETGATSYQLPATSGSVFDHLAASSLELDSTLITGGDTRIGGDLSIDGTLNASSLFVPNGLTIDGGVVMNGLFDAQELHVSSGATIDGVLTINGTLNLGSGTTLDFGSGALSLRQLLVEDSLFVMGDITIQGMATFLGNLNVRGELTVSANQAGFAMIPATGTSVTVHFGTGFTGTPVVTASPDVPLLYAVYKSSATGFTIRLAAPATDDVTFAWHALSTNAPLTIRAELTSNGTIAFPVASDNIPVSSNMVWNACIRNITVLDDQGQPLSCGRYHESYNWTHPDLGITFIWNTSLTPALLQLPEGYEAEVTEDAQSIIDAINGTGEEGVDTETTKVSDTGSTTATGSVTPEEQPVIEEAPVIEEEPVIEEDSTVEAPVTSDAPAQEPIVEPNTVEPEVIE